MTSPRQRPVYGGSPPRVKVEQETPQTLRAPALGFDVLVDPSSSLTRVRERLGGDLALVVAIADTPGLAPSLRTYGQGFIFQGRAIVIVPALVGSASE